MTWETVRKPSVYAGLDETEAGKTVVIIKYFEMEASSRSASFLFALEGYEKTVVEGVTTGMLFHGRSREPA